MMCDGRLFSWVGCRDRYCLTDSIETHTTKYLNCQPKSKYLLKNECFGVDRV